MKHQRQKEVIEAQANAQNHGKIAQELIKGQNAVNVAESKNTNTESKKSKLNPKIEYSTGRTLLNMPTPRRNIVPYKVPETGNIPLPKI